MRSLYILSLSFFIVLPLQAEGMQLFRSKKSSEKDNTSQSSRNEREVIADDFVKTEVTTRKNIESVIPVKRIPNGWVFRDELLAPWESNLPAVLSIIPDTTVEVIYHDDNRTTREGFVLPIKRASVEFQYTSRLTHELIMLEFVNVDFIYSTTNNNDSHFILEGITKKVKLKDTGFPQLAASDIIKHKVLMEYGSPKEFDGVWHIYEDINSTYKVRELDERNIKVETKSLQVTDKLEKAIDEADAIMLLRIQHERQTQTHFPSLEEYSRMFGLRKNGCKPSAKTLILHPGPINRGVEIDTSLADSENSVIINQVSNGVIVRMAILHLCCAENNQVIL